MRPCLSFLVARYIPPYQESADDLRALRLVDQQTIEEHPSFGNRALAYLLKTQQELGRGYFPAETVAYPQAAAGFRHRVQALPSVERTRSF